MRNNFPKQSSSAPLYSLSSFYAVHFGFVPPPPRFLSKCLDLFAIAVEWLLLDISWFFLLITRLLRLVGRWARKPVNHTSWVTVVTPTDRPKSVRNRCVIEVFCGVVYVVTLPFWHFCWCMGFCHRTESDLFLFLLFISYIEINNYDDIWTFKYPKCAYGPYC